MTRLGLLLVIVVASGSLLAAQSDRLRFEVASVKLWRPPTTRVTSVVMPATPPVTDSFYRRVTLAELITYAYRVQDHQLSGGPDWLRHDRYEVSAKAARAVVAQSEFPEMLKALLEERFKLQITIESREMPIIELHLARRDRRVGPNLHDCSDAGDTAGISSREKPFVAPIGGAVAAADCADGLNYLLTLSSRQLGATVEDKTGLMGQWRFNVYFVNPLLDGPANPNLPSFVGALGEQLGLRLERTRGPVPVVVIESVERPTPD